MRRLDLIGRLPMNPKVVYFCPLSALRRGRRGAQHRTWLLAEEGLARGPHPGPSQTPGRSACVCPLPCAATNVTGGSSHAFLTLGKSFAPSRGVPGPRVRVSEYSCLSRREKYHMDVSGNSASPALLVGPRGGARGSSGGGGSSGGAAGPSGRMMYRYETGLGGQEGASPGSGRRGGAGGRGVAHHMGEAPEQEGGERQPRSSCAVM